MNLGLWSNATMSEGREEGLHFPSAMDRACLHPRWRHWWPSLVAATGCDYKRSAKESFHGVKILSLFMVLYSIPSVDQVEIFIKLCPIKFGFWSYTYIINNGAYLWMIICIKKKKVFVMEASRRKIICYWNWINTSLLSLFARQCWPKWFFTSDSSPTDSRCVRYHILRGTGQRCVLGSAGRNLRLKQNFVV